MDKKETLQIVGLTLMVAGLIADSVAIGIIGMAISIPLWIMGELKSRK